MAAVIETVKMILLTCFRANHNAANLYIKLGFVATGLDDDEFGEPNYQLSGAALDIYRSA